MSCRSAVEFIEISSGKVAQGAFDGEAEQVADAADVAAGGAGVVKDFGLRA